jgi:hypothetical protein
VTAQVVLPTGFPLRSDGMAWRSRKRYFNGLHLRLEADAAAWIEMFGGLHTLWGYYLNAAKGAGFDRRTPLVRSPP